MRQLSAHNDSTEFHAVSKAPAGEIAHLCISPMKKLDYSELVMVEMQALESAPVFESWLFHLLAGGL